MTTTEATEPKSDSSTSTSTSNDIIQTLGTTNPKASHYLFLATLPCAAGTFIGYRRAVAKAGKITAGHSEKQIIARAPVLAAKALGLGTLASFAGVGLFVSGFMYAMGVSDLSEFVTYWKRWERPAFIDQLKLDMAASTKEAAELKKDLLNVRRMNENEELDYISNKYFSHDEDVETKSK